MYKIKRFSIFGSLFGRKDKEDADISNKINIELPKEYDILSRFVTNSENLFGTDYKEYEYIMYPSIYSPKEISDNLVKYNMNDVFRYGAMSEGSPISLSYDFDGNDGWTLDDYGYKKLGIHVDFNKLKQSIINRINQEVKRLSKFPDEEDEEMILHYSKFIKFIRSYNFR